MPHDLTPPAAPFTRCRCPEADLFRAVLAGEIPAVDTAMWAALLALVDAAAAHRLTIAPDLEPGPTPVPGLSFTELRRRRDEPRMWARCGGCGRHHTTPGRPGPGEPSVPDRPCRRCARPTTAHTASRRAVAA